MNGDRAINIRYKFDYTGLQRGTRDASRELGEIGKEGKKQVSELDAAFQKLGKTIAGVFAVDKIKDFAGQVVKVRGEYQQLEVAFETMLGNKRQADALMEQLIKTAATTPFGMNDIANSAKQLLAYGVEAEKVNGTLIRLGDIAAGLSIPINDLAYLYGTTMVQGRLYTQDLNQFLNRGIPLVEELAKQFNVAESEVKKLVEEGKVGFPEVEKAIKALTDEGSKFGGLMEKQSKTIAGQISNIEDAIEQMFNKIGQSSEGLISDVLGAVSFAVENWREIGKVIETVAIAYGTYKGVLLAAIVVEKTMQAVQYVNNRLIQEAIVQKNLAAMASISLSNAEAMAAAKTVLFSRAMHALKVAIMTNPIGILAGILATVAGALVLATTNTDELAEAQENERKRIQELIDTKQRQINAEKELAQALEQETKQLEQTRAQLTLNIQKLKDFKGTKEQEKKLVQEMNNAYGETMGYFNSVSDWYKALTENSEAYCRQMVLEARTRRLANQIAEAEQQKHDIIYDENGNMRMYSTARERESVQTGYGMYGEATYSPVGAEIAGTSDLDKARASIAQLNSQIANLEKLMQEAASQTQDINFSVKGSTKKDGDGGGSSKDNKAQGQIDQEIAERKQAIRDYARQIILANAEAELEIEQERINQLNEGYEKTSRQIQINYRKLIIDNSTREREMIEELAKARLNAWRNKNPQATKEQQIAYMESLLSPESETRLRRKDLDAGQQATLKAYDDLATQYRNRARDLMEKTNREAMDEYLKEYGSLQERIDAINRIYQRKAEEAGNQGERMAITQEWNNALNEVNFEDFMTNRAALAFGEVDNLSKETIDALIVELEKYRSKVLTSFDPEKIREFEEALGKLRKASAIGTNNPLGNLFTPEFMRERRAAQLEINDAERMHNDLLEQKETLQDQLQQKTTTLLALVKQHTGKELTADQAKDGVTVQAIINALRDQATQSKTDGNDEEANRYTAMANAIQGASNELVDLQVNLNQTAQASDQAKTYFDKLTNSFKTKFTGQNGAIGSILGMVNLVNGAIQGVNQAFSDIKNTAELLGADTSEGSGWDKAQNIMDALVGWSDGVQQIVQSALSGNIAGVIGGIPQIFTSWIGAFAKMHDAGNERRIKALQEEVDDLDRQNKRLDRQLKGQYSKEARDTNEEKIKAAQQQINLLRQQIAEEEDKKNTDDDRIQEWRDKIESLQNDIEDYKDAALDAVIGEDISSSIDNFADALVNAWGKAGEQARNIKDLVKTMLKQMVVEAMKTDLSAPITKFREMMALALEDNVVTTAEQQALEDYAKDIAKYIDQRYDWASDIFKESGGGQSGGESGGFATASQDSVEELSGRAAAIHTTLEMSRQMLAGMSIDIGSFKKELEAQREIASETRNLQLIAVGHLEDIARNTHELYQINERLRKIEINTRGL